MSNDGVFLIDQISPTSDACVSPGARLRHETVPPMPVDDAHDRLGRYEVRPVSHNVADRDDLGGAHHDFLITERKDIRGLEAMHTKPRATGSGYTLFFARRVWAGVSARRRRGSGSRWRVIAIHRRR